LRAVRRLLLLLLAAPVVTTGCVKRVATGAVADALSGSGGVYGQDDDPELVEAAVPFGLKTMEGVAVERPEHTGLLTSLAAGFVQYGYAFVEQRAHQLEDDDLTAAEALRARAQKHYKRALKYALQGLSVAHPGAAEALIADPAPLIATLEARDVPLMYWTAAAWGLVIAGSNLDPEALANLPTVKKLGQRALDLDPTWGDGVLHELMLSLETAAPGGSLEAAEQHYRAALQLSGGRRAGTLVSYAENVCVKKQDARGFHAALKAALAIDVDASPDDRLANIIMQRRARRLQARSGDLFLEDLEDGAETSTGAEGNTP
jgi:predicted anti-sigma-YlaC factor YlaD